MIGRIPRHVATFVAALGISAAAAGCSAAGTPTPSTTSSPTGSTSPAPSTGGTPTPGGSSAPDALLLRISTDGGFVPPGFIVTRVPETSVYADGRVIQPGAVPAIYPGPPVAPLILHRLDRSGVEAVRAAARAAGMAGPNRSYTTAPVADAPTTVFTYVDADGTHLLSIYALGFQLAPGASAEEKAARIAAANLVKAVGEIVNAAGSSETYQPTAYRIYASRADTPASPAATAGLPAPNVLDWPADLPALASLPPAKAGPLQAGCGIVQGAALPSFTGLLGRATQITRYREARVEWTLLIRPLLPDEARTCA